MSTQWEVVNRAFDALVQGDTAFFVFISGFLFYKIFYKRGFEYKTFLKGKFFKVFLPWFIITTLLHFTDCIEVMGIYIIVTLLYIVVIYTGLFGTFHLLCSYFYVHVFI